MSGKVKLLIAIVVIVVLGGVVSNILGGGGGEGPQVRVEAVESRDLVAKVIASGNIRARVQVDISSDVSARVDSVHVAEGEDVREGELLLELDRTQFEASLNRAQAALSQSRAQESQQEANLLQARREYERVQQLQARDARLVSVQQVEDAETAFRVAEANLESAGFAVEQSEAGVEEAQDRLDQTIFRAPMDGRVTRLNVEKGETVVVGTMNNAGSLVLSISDLSVMEVVLRVDETDVPLLTLGDSAAVKIDAFPDRTFAGRVTEISNSAVNAPSQQSGSQQAIDFEVVLTLDVSEEELRPDLSATADIVTDVRSGAVAVPIIAVTLRDQPATGAGATPGETVEAEGVFLISGDQVRFQAVELGIAGDEHFEVLGGLNPGDSVVAGPYQAIRDLNDGDVVSRLDAGPSAAASGASRD